MRGYLSLLTARRNFRYLWLAQVVSLAGDWFNLVAVIILVNRYTDSGAAIGAFFLARSLPPFVWGPVAGVFADRFDRRLILIWTDLLRMVTVLGLLLVNSADRAWLIYVLSLAQFTVSAFFEPARAAILPALVEGDDELLAANTLSSVTWSAMLAVGAAAGGVITALLGVEIALLIDAASFALSAILTALIRTSALPHAEGDSVAGGFKAYWEGLRYVIQRPTVGFFTLIKGGGQFGNIDVIVTLYAAQVFILGKDGALALGLMYAAAGVGSVTGPLITDMLGESTRHFLQRAILAGFYMIPLSWLLIGVAPALPLVMVGLVLRGMGGSINWTYSSVLIQLSVRNDYLGRVFALDFGLFTLVYSISIWWMGVAVDTVHLSPRELALAVALFSIFPALAWTGFVARTQAAPLTPP